MMRMLSVFLISLLAWHAALTTAVTAAPGDIPAALALRPTPAAED